MGCGSGLFAAQGEVSVVAVSIITISDTIRVFLRNAH